MGISDITSGLLVVGVEISSGRSPGCPAVRTGKGFWSEGCWIGCRVEGAGEKFFFSRQTLDFAKGVVTTMKFPPLFLNLLNHPLRDPLLYPVTHDLFFTVLPHSRYSSDLATINFAAHREVCTLWNGFYKFGRWREKGLNFNCTFYKFLDSIEVTIGFLSDGSFRKKIKIL